MKNKFITTLMLLSSVAALGACGNNEEKAPSINANETTLSHRDATQVGFEIAFSDFDLAKHALTDVKMHANDEAAFTFEASSTINGYCAKAKKSGTFTVWGTLNDKESNKITLTVGEAQFANVKFGFNEDIQIVYEYQADLTEAKKTFTLTKIGNCYMSSVADGGEFFYDASNTDKYLYGFDKKASAWKLTSTNPSDLVLDASLFRFLKLTNNDEYVSKKSESFTIGDSTYSVDTYSFGNETYSYHDGSDFGCVLKANRDGEIINVTNIIKGVTEFPFATPEK